MEKPYTAYPGIISVVSGYAGGDAQDATYDKVSSGRTSHVEAVQIEYDPAQISFEELLDIFWKQIDPTDDEGQFADRGPQYKTAIFYHDGEQREIAEQSRHRLAKELNAPVATELLAFTTFFPAEEHHQQYYKKNPTHYQRYFSGSGRKEQIMKNMKLSASQYEILFEGATEPPFDNEHWDNKQEGIYVDVISGEPLFSSQDKFDSGTGWPSFTKAIGSVVEKTDKSHGMVRTEVIAARSQIHLGHVFADGPTGVRYCINSVALRFIPKEQLEKAGYGAYAETFSQGA